MWLINDLKNFKDNNAIYSYECFFCNHDYFVSLKHDSCDSKNIWFIINL